MTSTINRVRRKQEIEDGFLNDVSDLASRLGLTHNLVIQRRDHGLSDVFLTGECEHNAEVAFVQAVSELHDKYSKLWKEVDSQEDSRQEACETPNKSFAEIAKELVLGERNGTYGDPRADFGKTALLWSGLLHEKLREGVTITPKEVTLMMVALKLSREMHMHKDDNIIDAHGYLMLAQWLESGEKPK